MSIYLHRRAIFLPILAALIHFAILPLGAAPYHLTDLGVLNEVAGATNATLSGINLGGQVVGISASNQFYRSFVYNGTRTDLGSLGGTNCYARGINLSNIICGTSINSNGFDRAFRWQTNGMIDLGVLGAGHYSEAFDINTAGQITGDSSTDANDSIFHAVRFESGSTNKTDIGKLLPTGWDYSVGFGINASGQVVGLAIDYNLGYSYAFFYNGVSVAILGDFTSSGIAGNYGSEANSINSNGQIVGDANDTSYIPRAFRWVPGATNGVAVNPQMIDLGTLGGTYSKASCINNSNVVVGTASIAGDAANHAFVAVSNTPVDLNTQLDDGSSNSWVLVAAESINDYGQIVGTGTNNGVLHGFLLTPDQPVITSPPSGLMVVAGSNATLNVSVIGSTPAYQWRFNGTNLSGATTNFLTISNFQSANAGNYDVVITNVYGAVTSSVAIVGLAGPPSILIQPAGTNLTAFGISASFTVGASGSSPLAYQWRFNGTNLSGAITNPFVIRSAQATNAGNYDVVITNAYGSITSAVAVLTLNFLPSITNQPVSTNMTSLPGNAVFRVGATGTAVLAYQWRFNSNEITGAISNVLTLINARATNVGFYDVIVTNNFGAVTSAVASLTGNFPPSITNQPSSAVVLLSNSATFVVGASGNALGYRWRFNGANISGANTNPLVIPIAQASNTGNYDVVVTNTYGSVTSAVVSLTVNVPVQITSQPVAAAVVVSSNATFTVGVSGTAPILYQWRFNGGAISGATSNVFAVIAAQGTNAGDYDVIVTNNFGAVTSSIATLTVNFPPSITNQPVSTNMTVLPGNAEFRVGASGTALLAYQWRFNSNAIAGAVSNVLIIPNAQVTNAGSYDVIVTNNYGAVTSAVATLTGNFPPSITTNPASTNLTSFGSRAAFSVGATGPAPLAYQWRFNGASLSGGTTNPLVIPSAQATNAGNYDVVVVNNFGAVTSSVAALTLNFKPVITNPPVSVTVANVGASTNFSVGASGTAPLVYQWRFKSNAIAGAIANVLAISSVQYSNIGSYDVIVTNNFGAVTSAVVSLNGNFPPQITNNPADIAVIVSNSAPFTVGANGSSLGYRWRFNGTNITGATTNPFVIPIARSTNAGNYDVVVTNTFGAVTSLVATLTVYFPPSITNQPVSTNMASLSGNAVFRVGASGTAVLAYQWRFNSNAIAGAITNLLTITNPVATNAGSYDVIVTNNYGSVTSAVVSLTGNFAPIITNQPVSLGVPTGSNATFSVGVSGSATLRYNWRFFGTNLPSGTNALLTITNVQSAKTGSYYVIVTNAYGRATSEVAVLTLGQPVSITNQPASITVLVGADASFTVGVSGGAPLAYQWRLNGASLGAANASLLTVTNAQSTNAGNYTVVVTNSFSSVTSAIAALTIVGKPVITGISTQGTNALVSFTTAAGATYYLEGNTNLASVKWVNVVTNIPGTGATRTATNYGIGGTPSQWYRVRVTVP